MKSIIQFNIAFENGVYTADGVNAPIVTEGSTFEELQENIRDAVALYFEGDDRRTASARRLHSGINERWINAVLQMN